MKNIILLLFILTFASSLFAGNESADAVYLKLVKEYTLHDDGRVTYHHSHQLQLLSYFSFSRRYGETFVVYDTTFQKLTIKTNTTTMADGKQVVAPANAYNLVLPRFARNAADYNQLREMVITHIALERDAIIDLDYEIESAPDFLPGLMGDQILAEDSPINEYVLRIKIPANQNLQFHLYHSDVQPVSKTENGQKIYEWLFKNVPAFVHEPIQAVAGDFLPRIQFSTVDDLKNALEPLHRQFRANNSLPKITLEGNSELERILNLQKKVVQEMAAFPVPLATIGYRFRSPDQVWQSNGGTPFEKAIFMASILAASDVNAKPVLIASSREFDSAIASLSSFQKAGVCVHMANGQAFMLDIDKLNTYDLRYIYGGRQALVFTTDGIKTPLLPKPKSEQNSAEMNMQIVIRSADSLSGHFNVNLSGAAQPYLELQRKQDQGVSLLKKIISSSKFTGLSTFSENNIGLQASFEQADGIKSQKNYLFYPLPQNPYGIASLHLSNLSTTRFTPAHLPYTNFMESNKYLISIPESYKVVTKPIAIQKENAVGKLEIRISSKEGSIEIERSFKLSKQDISMSAYDEFMELWRLWKAPAYKQLVLTKK